MPFPGTSDESPHTTQTKQPGAPGPSTVSSRPWRHSDLRCNEVSTAGSSEQAQAGPLHPCCLAGATQGQTDSSAGGSLAFATGGSLVWKSAGWSWVRSRHWSKVRHPVKVSKIKTQLLLLCLEWRQEPQSRLFLGRAVWAQGLWAGVGLQTPLSWGLSPARRSWCSVGGCSSYRQGWVFPS